MRKKLGILLVAVLSISLIACVNEKPKDNGTVYVTNVTMSNIYKTNTAKRSDAPIASFTDGLYNYFFFKIGEINRVPIAYSNTKFYQGIGTRTLTFETSESVEQTVATAVENCFSIAISNKVGISVGSEWGVKNEATGAMAAASVLLETSVQTTAQASTSKTFTNSISDTFSKVERDSFELKPGSPVGFYRFTVYADCDVYGLIKANKESRVFEYTYFTFIKNNSKIEGWFYSEDGYFESEEVYAESIEKLTLTDEMLNSINLFGNVDKYLNIGKKGLSFSTNGNAIDTDHEFTVDFNLKEIFDFDLAKKVYTRIRIAVSFDLVTPKGDCQATFLLENGANQLYYQDWTKITSSGKSFSKDITISMDEIVKNGTEFLMRFRCRSDGILDLKYNSYRVDNGKFIIWFE